MVWLYWPSISFGGGKFLEIPTKFLRNWKSRLCKVLYFCQFVENESDSLSQKEPFFMICGRKPIVKVSPKFGLNTFVFRPLYLYILKNFRHQSCLIKKCKILFNKSNWKTMGKNKLGKGCFSEGLLIEFSTAKTNAPFCDHQIFNLRKG